MTIQQQFKMIKKIIILSISVAIIVAQSCSDSGKGPCLNGGCFAGHTCTGNICCANDKIVQCADKLNPNTGKSDCPNMANYCTNSLYMDMMATECPLTCGKCKAENVCCDKVGSNGVSDCPRMAAYCNNSLYYDMMTTECPVTCGRCPK